MPQMEFATTGRGNTIRLKLPGDENEVIPLKIDTLHRSSTATKKETTKASTDCEFSSLARGSTSATSSGDQNSGRLVRTTSQNVQVSAFSQGDAQNPQHLLVESIPEDEKEYLQQSSSRSKKDTNSFENPNVDPLPVLKHR